MATAVEIEAHAAARMDEMGVTRGEVDSVLAYPIRTYRQKQTEREVFIGRRISVITTEALDDPEHLYVVTVIWSDEEAYHYLGRRTL